ncbi:MAG: class I SAM-dependent methyltransferase [Verrucomicrobiota bacterium]
MSIQAQPSILDRYSHLQTVLCCPRTKGPLRLVAIEDLLPLLSDAERQRIPEDTIGAFISDTINRAYPITSTAANFIEQDSLEIHDVSARAGSCVVPALQIDDVKRSVKDWYDRWGWKKNDLGLYKDTALFSQNKPVGYGLYEMMSHLSILDRLPGDGFVLDAASGAIAHPEYLAFSWFYQNRVCVDMSITALREAKEKVRPTDFCCLADICNLPFRNETFDGVVSGYTIQHIPEPQQKVAIRELYRILRPNTHLCIFTSVESANSRKHKCLVFVLWAIQKLLRALRLSPSPCSLADSVKPENPPHSLYYHGRHPARWKEVAMQLTDNSSVETLRLLQKSEFEALYGRSNRAAKALRLIESLFPKASLGMSYCCVIDICKSVRINSPD